MLVSSDDSKYCEIYPDDPVVANRTVFSLEDDGCHPAQDTIGACIDYRVDDTCNGCIQHDGCGACDGYCFAGTENGPNYTSKTCDEWRFKDTSGETCSCFTNCTTCHEHPGCTWCYTESGYSCLGQDYMSDCLVVSSNKQCTSSAPVNVEGGISRVYRVEGTRIQIWTGSWWETRFWLGVNLGATVPGHNPGELAATTAQDVRRFLGWASDLGVDAIRIYTRWLPHLYNELADFNRQAKKPIYLIQGIYPHDADLDPQKDVFTSNLFSDTIRDTVRAIHGNVTVKGTNGATYTVDVSKYVMGYVLEASAWSPQTIDALNWRFAGMQPHSNKYITAKPGAPAFEIFLANMMNIVAETDMEAGWQHPISCSSGTKFDPMEHPLEPEENQDMVSIDFNYFTTTPEFKAGIFGQYGVFPYYPQFLKKEYTDCEACRNSTTAPITLDPLSGYLRHLQSYYPNIPLIIGGKGRHSTLSSTDDPNIHSEFGVPSSSVRAREGVAGRHMGNHTEKQQGIINLQLFNAFFDEGFAGAFLFQLVDEWWKSAWNMEGLTIPNPRWRNSLSVETQFGVIAAEPGSQRRQIYLDGNLEDWERRGSEMNVTTDGTVVKVTHDESYIYIAINSTIPFNTQEKPVYIAFDSWKGDPDAGDLFQKVTLMVEQETFEVSTPWWVQKKIRPETIIKLSGPLDSYVFVHLPYDAFVSKYFNSLSGIPSNWYNEVGKYWVYRLPISLDHIVNCEEFPLQSDLTGKLTFGSTNATHPHYISTADWFVSGNVLEIRVPWMFLGITDPSQKHVHGNHKENQPIQDNLKVYSIAQLDIDIFTSASQKFNGDNTIKYSWKSWDAPTYYYRKKDSFYVLKKSIQSLSLKPRTNCLPRPAVCQAQVDSACFEDEKNATNVVCGDGCIAGIAVGGTAFLVGSVVGVIFLLKWRERAKVGTLGDAANKKRFKSSLFNVKKLLKNREKKLNRKIVFK